MLKSLKHLKLWHHTILSSWKSSSSALQSNWSLNCYVVSGCPYCLKAANAYDRPFCTKRSKNTGIVEARGRKIVLEFICIAHFLGGYFAIGHLLHTLLTVLLCLQHSPSGASCPWVVNTIRHRECIVPN